MRDRIADWYRDAKLGIMIHWGLYSVPGYAETGNGTPSEILSRYDWPHYFAHNPYAEWYQNSLRAGAPSTRAFHRKSYRPGFEYRSFADLFNDGLDKWEPSTWGELFAEAGARYVVYVTKHHDGFLMWPSSSSHVEGYTARRNTVSELADAVRQNNLRFGVYYSGLLDWTFQTEPITDAADMVQVEPDEELAAYVQGHYEELIRDIKPDILWNDIGLAQGVDRRRLLEHYRKTVPDGVVNDRWNQTPGFMKVLLRLSWFRKRLSSAARRAVVSGRSLGRGDFATSEYGPEARFSKHPWEAVRGIGNSFGFNREESADDYDTGHDLMRTLVDVVSKNGNLLLNVGPEADGMIPQLQRSALVDLSVWMRVNSSAIHGTRPWYRSEGTTGDGEPVRFTTKPGTLYAILLNRPARLSVLLKDIPPERIPRVSGTTGRTTEAISLLGFDYAVEWRRTDRDIEVRLPGSLVPNGPLVIVIRRNSEDERPPRVDMYTDVIG